MKDLNVNVENLEFLATCDDLKWLAVGYPDYVPEPVKKLVENFQKTEAKKAINDIEKEIKSIKTELEKRGNDLLDAKDRLHPFSRKIKKMLGHTIIFNIVSLGTAILALLATSIGLAISDIYGYAWYEGVIIFDGGTLLVVTFVKTLKYRRILSKRVDKFFKNIVALKKAENVRLKNFIKTVKMDYFEESRLLKIIFTDLMGFQEYYFWYPLSALK